MLITQKSGARYDAGERGRDQQLVLHQGSYWRSDEYTMQRNIDRVAAAMGAAFGFFMATFSQMTMPMVGNAGVIEPSTRQSVGSEVRL